MFAEYSLAELSSIFAMQGFAGLILFAVLVLMALVKLPSKSHLVSLMEVLI